MLTDDDDGALVRAARGGDRGAMAFLLIRHRPVLLALCRQRLGDAALAEDAAQEASLQALLHLDRLRQAERFGSWLAGIGLNLCRMWLRERGRDGCSWDALNGDLAQGGHAGVETMQGATSVLHMVDGDPEARTAAADLSASVRDAVAALPGGQRTAVQLFYLAGLSYKETAALLGIEEGAVRTRLHKAREALRGRLRLLGEEEHLGMGDRIAMEEATMAEPKKEYTCSFCGKRNAEVRRMIAGPAPLDAAICDECIARCNQILADAEAQAAQ